MKFKMIKSRIELLIIILHDKLYWSFADMYIKAKITLTFNISLKVGHLEVVINPVNDEIWEPRVFSASLEKFIK